MAKVSSQSMTHANSQLAFRSPFLSSSQLGELFPGDHGVASWLRDWVATPWIYFFALRP